MRYRHKPTGVIAEFIRTTAHGWLCVDAGNRHHWMIYPEAQWEAA